MKDVLGDPSVNYLAPGFFTKRMLCPIEGLAISHMGEKVIVSPHSMTPQSQCGRENR